MLWQRVSAGYAQVLRAHPGQDVVIVGHGGVIAMTTGLLCPEADMATALRQENFNCAVTQVTAGVAGCVPVGRLVHYGAWDHLSGTAAEIVSSIPDEHFWRTQAPLTP